MSWVIVWRESGAAYCETFSSHVADHFRIQKARFEVVPIREWLARVNAAAKPAANSPTPLAKSAGKTPSSPEPDQGPESHTSETFSRSDR